MSGMICELRMTIALTLISLSMSAVQVSLDVTACSGHTVGVQLAHVDGLAQVERADLMSQ